MLVTLTRCRCEWFDCASSGSSAERLRCEAFAEAAAPELPRIAVREATSAAVARGHHLHVKPGHLHARLEHRAFSTGRLMVAITRRSASSRCFACAASRLRTAVDSRGALAAASIISSALSDTRFLRARAARSVKAVSVRITACHWPSTRLANDASSCAVFSRWWARIFSVWYCADSSKS